MSFLMQEVLFASPKKPGRKSPKQKIAEDEEIMQRWLKIQDRGNLPPTFEDLDLSKVRR